MIRSWLYRMFRDEQHSSIVNFFRTVSIFHGMTSRQLGRIALAMQKRHYRAGEVLFAQGQVGRAVFIVRSGQVELTREYRTGLVKRLGILGPGHIFGEMALLENRPRTASAYVTEDAVIYLLYTSSLDALMKKNPQIGTKLMRNMAIMLSTLLRKTSDHIDHKEQTKTDGRAG